MVDAHLGVAIVTKKPTILHRDQFSASKKIARFQEENTAIHVIVKIKVKDIKNGKKGLQFSTILRITRQHMHHMITISGCGSIHIAMLSSGEEQK